MKTATIFEKYNITESRVRSIIKTSRSYRGALIKLRWNEAGGAYKRLKHIISELKIDVSHFTGKGWSRGSISVPLDDYLSNKKYIKSWHLKKRLIKEKVKEHKCEKCSRTMWNSLPIPIELHHRDGDRYNNNLDNIMLLCCNCHAQTDTWRNKN